MAIDTNAFRKAFGQQSNRSTGSEDRPKAEFWLNIGYQVEYPTEEGTEMRFVSLPTGIPLDTQDPVKVSGKNEAFIQFQSARNDLMEQLLGLAKTLEPGEERIIGTGELVIQLRRVNAEVQAVKPTDNLFSKKLSLVA